MVGVGDNAEVKSDEVKKGEDDEEDEAQNR